MAAGKPRAPRKRRKTKTESQPLGEIGTSLDTADVTRQVAAITLGLTEIGLIRIALINPDPDDEGETFLFVDVSAADATAIYKGLEELIPMAEKVGGGGFIHEGGNA